METHIDGPREGELGEEAVSLGVERPDDAVVVRGRHSSGAAATEFVQKCTSSFSSHDPKLVFRIWNS